MARPTGPPPSRVLLVEGVDDKHVAGHIWRSLRGGASLYSCGKGKR